MGRRRLWFFWLVLVGLFIGPPAYLLRKAGDRDDKRRDRDREALAATAVAAARPVLVDFGPIATNTAVVRRIDPSGALRAIAVSPDGRLVLSAGQNAPPRLWDLSTGNPTSNFTVSPWGSSMAFSPRGDFAIAVMSNVLYQWSVPSGGFLRNMVSNYSTFQCVAVAPNARTALAGGADGSACIFNLSTGQLLGRLAASRMPVQAVGYSPDGARLMAAYGDGTVAVWDALSGRSLRQFHLYAGQKAAFSPDSRFVLIGGNDRSTRLYDLDHGALVHTLTGPALVNQLAFSPDSSRILTSHTLRLILWDAATGRKVAALDTDQVPTAGIAILPDNRHVISAGQNILVLDMPPAPATRPAR